MRILVTFAVEAEFASWRKLRPFRCVAKRPFEIYDAKIGDATVRVALTGIGWECARQVANAVMGDMFDSCISSGLAGGLKGQFKVGDILAFQSVGESGTRVMPSDAQLVQSACSAGARLASRLMTSKTLVITAEEKRRLGIFADAVDMESFRVMAAAQGRGIPAIALRAVSDVVDDDLPMDFSRHIAENGQVNTGRVLGEIARRPQVIPAMVRFGVQTRRAAEALAEFLDAFISKLADKSQKTLNQVAAT